MALFCILLRSDAAIVAPDSHESLSSATVGRLYAYVIETSKPALFTKIGGNADWLLVTPDGLITGTPAEGAPVISDITVEASWQGVTLRRSFVIPVQPRTSCDAGSGRFTWCDQPTSSGVQDPVDPPVSANPPKCMQDEMRPDRGCKFAFHATQGVDEKTLQCDAIKKDGCIVQFSRTIGDTGKFGHFTGNRIEFGTNVAAQSNDEGHVNAVIQAINGSNVFISGSVLIREDVHDCKYWSLTVVAQTTDSSNILIYGPPEASAFCFFGPADAGTSTGTLLIVLPAHAIWANVYGNPANVNDPAWKPIAEPKEYACWTGGPDTKLSRSIVPCDRHYQKPVSQYTDEQSNFFTRLIYTPPAAWLYNRLTQPGVSQGSLSFAPFALGIKQTWDVQTYASTRLGPGWIGLPFTYEFDHTQRDNLNSLTAALMYDLRFDDKRQYWLAAGPAGCGRHFSPLSRTTLNSCQDTTPEILVRPLEFSVRYGPEWAPAKLKCPTPSDPCQIPGQRPLRDLNMVAGAMFRLPVIVNPVRADWARQPGQFSFVPVSGIETGNRLEGHTISTGFENGVPVTATVEPGLIFRWVYGFDASIRWPYNFTRNFLGSRPLLVDASYRIRVLYMDEPITNLNTGLYAGGSPKVPELQYPSGRSYMRVTFIAPFSAYLQMRLSWQHGSLPPAFWYVDNEVTMGITFANPGASEH